MPEHRVVILGAGKAVRGSLPSAIVPVDDHGRVLDWLLAAFSVLESPEVYFVGGYMADAVIEQYPHIRFVFNPAWQETGPVKSLSAAPLEAGHATYVSYSDVVFRPATVRRVEEAEADLVLAVDTRFRVRFDGRNPTELDSAEKVRNDGERPVDIGRHIDNDAATAEFIGLMKLSTRAVAKAEAIIKSHKLGNEAGLPALIRLLLDNGLSTSTVDVAGDWAELNAPQDLARFVLGTKAESLQRLQPLVRTGTIGKLVSFTHGAWNADRDRILRRIADVFGDTRLIVRSSALSEDNWLESSAGAHESVAEVPASDRNSVVDAVVEVLRSYGQPVAEDQVLVQKMLTDVSMSGVVMTRTPALGAPYYVINFDNTTRRTDTVTAGIGKSVRTVFLHREAKLREGLPRELGKLMEVVTELERLVGHDMLDIEFAFSADGVAHVLQVRPIAVGHVDQRVDDNLLAARLGEAVAFYRTFQKPSPFLLGHTTQLSVMSDWNPAEIVGVKPKRLALSLYRYLITDEIWARQRAEYGYRDVRPCNLIIEILGHPYVDVRATFNSFLPADLPQAPAQKLLEHYLAHLRCQPELHDKVEFDVLFTCLSFDFDRKADRLRKADFDEDEIDRLRESLLTITRNGMARIDRDMRDLELLQQRFARIRSADLPPLEAAYLYLEDTRRYGTPAFSHLARGAFVAVTLLRSLESVGALSSDEIDAFLASITTVSSDIQQDASRVAAGSFTWGEFVETYGHLRPGTYDITSPAYGSAPEEFLRPMVGQIRQPKATADDLWDSGTRSRISNELARAGLDPSVDAFERFLRRAIEMREYGKFLFTRNLSEALESLTAFGSKHGVDQDELSHIRIHDLLALRFAVTSDTTTALKELAAAGKQAFLMSQAICLPSQVFDAEDLVCFEQIDSEPNFVTRKTVRAPVTALSMETSPEVELKGKIVLISNADPGFDWIFTREIAGLITMYGGANSHMTIRSAEFELPAAIGVGGLLYEEILKAGVLEMDCASRKIRVVR